MIRIVCAIAFAFACGGASTVSLATSHDTRAGVQTAAALSQGEVRKVEKGAAEITIRHGPLANRDMPGMTMVQVKERAMLDHVKPGNKIQFVADGVFTVTRIESVR